MPLHFFLKKFKSIVGKRIYSNDTVLLMELNSPSHQTSGARIQPVNFENVYDAATFQSKKQISGFKKFLQLGYKGYYAYLEKNCIHRSWVIIGPARVYLHKFYSIPLYENEIFVEYCETAQQARGKNIFAHVLTHIGNEYADKKILTSVDIKNKSSIRSMNKAGFEAIRIIKINVILGFKRITSESAKGKV